MGHTDLLQDFLFHINLFSAIQQTYFLQNLLP